MTRTGRAIVLIFATLCTVSAKASPTNNDQVLTNAVQVLSLTRAQAGRHIPVSITGVVTLCEPDWGGLFFVQDQTGGVFVNNKNEPPAPGDLIHVCGTSHAGGYAPDIIFPTWEKLGTAPLPDAKPVSGERFVSGAEDGQRVEVSGIVRTAEVSEDGKRLAVILSAGGCRFQAFSPQPDNLRAVPLVGATVRVRGTAAASFNQQLGHLVAVSIFAPRASDFIVDSVPGDSIFSAPFTAPSAIPGYRRQDSPDPRIRVRGAVVYQRPGEDVFIQDKTGGLQIKCRDTNVFLTGEVIEAIGFPVMERFLPVLEDAVLRRTKELQTPNVDRTATLPGILGGRHQSELIALKGKLLDRSLRPVRGAGAQANSQGEYVLTLQLSNYLFSVTAPATSPFANLSEIRIGSSLEVSGICSLQTSHDGAVEAIQILLPDAASVRVLQRPSWWTRQYLLTGLSVLLAVFSVGAAWTLTILRKNSALRSSIAKKMKAQQDLRYAHDMLETRVLERTRQLRVEMSARKEAEVQFCATVAERRRIAQELHDTLLQGFTGIGLKLESIVNTLPSSLGATKEQLQKILERSDEYLVEARRAVWELRSPSLDRIGDFSEALRKVCERAIHGAGVPLSFTVGGESFKLNQGVEDNLLRICEEAVANAAKHASPSQVEVALEFGSEKVQFRVRDDGCGFESRNGESLKEGHYGLVGIQERSKAIKAEFSIYSRPGAGTEVAVILMKSVAAAP